MPSKQSPVNRDWLKEKFGNIENKLDSLSIDLREHVAEDRRQFHEMTSSLNDYNLRADRLEQVESSRKWHIRTLWAGVMAAVAGMTGGFFK